MGPSMAGLKGAAASAASTALRALSTLPPPMFVGLNTWGVGEVGAESSFGGLTVFLGSASLSLLKGFWCNKTSSGRGVSLSGSMGSDFSGSYHIGSVSAVKGGLIEGL